MILLGWGAETGSKSEAVRSSLSATSPSLLWVDPARSCFFAVVVLVRVGFLFVGNGASLALEGEARAGRDFETEATISSSSSSPSLDGARLQRIEGVAGGRTISLILLGRGDETEFEAEAVFSCTSSSR